MKKIIVYLVGSVMLFLLQGCIMSSLSPEKFQSSKLACDKGNGKKCYQLGRMYMEGIGTQISEFKAGIAFKKGCEANNKDACREYDKLQSPDAERSNKAAETPKLDRNTALTAVLPSQFESTKSACQNGDGEKCYVLGNMYKKGIGTEKSISKAKDAYTKGCEKSNATTLESCYALGKLYLDGSGIARNNSMAFKLFSHTCKDTFTKGCGALGHLYYQGKGVDQNITKAIKFLTIGCDANDAKSCATLGTVYITGQGVNEDYKKAYKAFYKACQKGDALGCYNLGNMYENAIGREQSKNDALYYYKLSCSGGLSEGCESAKLLN